MAVDLSNQGFWSIDIGNIDKEYEWFENSAKTKTRNPYKFSMEVKGGADVLPCNDNEYLSEIIHRVGC